MCFVIFQDTRANLLSEGVQDCGNIGVFNTLFFFCFKGQILIPVDSPPKLSTNKDGDTRTGAETDMWVYVQAYIDTNTHS